MDSKDTIDKGKQGNAINPNEIEKDKKQMKVLINVQRYIRRFLATKRFFSQDFNEGYVREFYIFLFLISDIFLFFIFYFMEKGSKLYNFNEKIFIIYNIYKRKNSKENKLH